MFENTDSNLVSNDHVVQRMFELVCEGQTESSEYALLDAVIQARLRQTYDDGSMDGADQGLPQVQAAA